MCKIQGVALLFVRLACLSFLASLSLWVLVYREAELLLESMIPVQCHLQSIHCEWSIPMECPTSHVPCKWYGVWNVIVDDHYPSQIRLSLPLFKEECVHSEYQEDVCKTWKHTYTILYRNQSQCWIHPDANNRAVYVDRTLFEANVAITSPSFVGMTILFALSSLLFVCFLSTHYCPSSLFHSNRHHPRPTQVHHIHVYALESFPTLASSIDDESQSQQHDDPIDNTMDDENDVDSND